MTSSGAPPRQEAARLLEYERWFAGVSPGALVFRWLMGAQAQLFTNGPLLRLPQSLTLNASARILDVGCGRGALLRAWDASLGLETPPTGIDFSRVALRQARADAVRAGGRAPRLLQASATAMPFRDGAFTLVTCGYVAKHLDDGELQALLREVHRVLEPGGLAVVWEFGPSGNPRLDAWNAAVVSRAVTRPRLRSTSTLRRHAAEAGFPFVRNADLRPFLIPPIARASVLLGKPPEGWQGPL